MGKYSIGCAIFAPFFIRFELIKANMDLIRYIVACFGISAIHHLFASFAYIRFNIFAQIRIQILRR
jgi:hypothetical protein